MQPLLIEHFSQFKDRIKLGSISIPNEEYPFYTFVMGCYIDKVRDIEHLFQLVEDIAWLKKCKVISNLSITQIFLLLHRRPEIIRELLRLFDAFKHKEGCDMIKSLEDLFTKHTTKEQSGLKQKDSEQERGLVKQQEKSIENKNQSDIPQRLGRCESKDTIVLGESQQWHDQEMAVDARQKDDDEEYARRIQEQEQKLCSKQVVDDDTVCDICYVGLYEQDYYLLDKCSHVFHKECLAGTFKSKISNNIFPLLCPGEGCKAEVINSDIKQILNKEDFVKFQDHTLKSYAEMHGDSISWCPTPACGYMFFYEKEDQERFECLECKKIYCLHCRVEWHKDMTCKEYKISSTVSADDQKFIEFVKGKKFKQCPKCKFWVEKNLGCDHMTCKCTFEFCYKCGGVYMKCECIQNARIQAQQRRLEFEARRAKKEERKRKMLEKAAEKAAKAAPIGSRRSKRGEK